jgi:hypothetical protein
MDVEELELFGKSIRRAAAASTSGADLDAALDEVGWRDALSSDPRAAVSILFGVQGAEAATSGALDAVLLDALEGADLDAAVVLPPLGSWSPPAELNGHGLVVHGLATGAIRRRTSALVATTGGRFCIVATQDLALRDVSGLDPLLGIVEVSGTPARATTRPSPSTAWEVAVAAGQRAIAHELVGATRAMLELARTHALDRVQFGQPIAGFQAVRHRLADVLVAVESADAVLDAAWLDGTPGTAAIAKAVAGRAAQLGAKHCQQVLAGIGFTAEHPLHRYIRRVLVLDRLLGDTRGLTRALGEEVLSTRQLPPMLPL